MEARSSLHRRALAEAEPILTDPALFSGPRVLSPECRLLAEVMEPPSSKDDFDQSLTVAFVKLSGLESATGLEMLK
jgi:hypothetical protein